MVNLVVNFNFTEISVKNKFHKISVKIDFDPKIMIFGSFLDIINFTEILVKINFTEISVISTEINNLVGKYT